MQARLDDGAGRRREEPMSYRELTMIDVREMLRRWTAGQGERRIARESGADRKTVRRYLAMAVQLGIERDAALDDATVQAVAQAVQARPIAAPSEERAELALHKDRIAAWLERKPRPLRLSKIHVLLARDGVRASYDTLRRFAKTELEWHRRPPTVRLDDPPPGQEAQVDFGEMGMITGPDGRRRKLWALIITLSFSRYQFVWPSLTQSTEDVCEGLDRAWMFFGGVPHTIIPDNLKAVIVQADSLAPTIAAAFQDYAQARGLFVDPARVRSPKDKPRVENQVAYVRESWFQGETFADLADARCSAEMWSRDVAGARLHGTTRQVPREVFETTERSTMLAAPTEPFDVPTWADAKVHADHHIQIARALYSVPTAYLQRTVRVRADRTSVRIYLGAELIKVHPRMPPGGRSTDPNDYPKEKRGYAMRSVDSLVGGAKAKGAHVGIYAERLLGGPLPWTRMRQAHALLRLCDKFGAGRVEAVCQSALAFDVVDVHRITRMLRNATTAATPTASATASNVVQLPLPRFARSLEHFQTRASVAGEELP
jgi:transposase